MTFALTKKVIETRLKQGTLDTEEMTIKLDAFLLNDRITDAQYNELIELMNG